MKIVLLTILSCVFTTIIAQQKTGYDLLKLLKAGMLENYSKPAIKEVTGTDKKTISASGITWIKGSNFTNGKIEIDLRGKNVFQQSFLGVVFHGTDTTHYEAVYFRPFNFKSPDSLRQKHCVEYMSMPDYPWYRLRKEHPLQYESSITPVPEPMEWFHIILVIDGDKITVYVNGSNQISLRVKSLGNQPGNMIGLFDDGLPGDFANLTITR